MRGGPDQGKMSPKRNPLEVWCRDLDANAPDMATAYFQQTRVLCDQVGQNVCPYRANLKAGRCPATKAPCPYAQNPSAAVSIQKELAAKKAAKQVAAAGR